MKCWQNSGFPNLDWPQYHSYTVKSHYSIWWNAEAISSVSEGEAIWKTCSFSKFLSLADQQPWERLYPWKSSERGMNLWKETNGKDALCAMMRRKKLQITSFYTWMAFKLWTKFLNLIGLCWTMLCSIVDSSVHWTQYGMRGRFSENKETTAHIRKSLFLEHIAWCNLYRRVSCVLSSLVLWW